jgi:site-specific recombinase XerD
MKQVRTAQKAPSERYHFRLDPQSNADIYNAVEWLERTGVSFSSSCIVRAAIRRYYEFLQTLDTAEKREQERTFIDRARRGLR